MRKQNANLTRRDFMLTTGTLSAGILAGGALSSAYAVAGNTKRMRIALVGTGVRGVAMYGRELVRDYSEYVEMVGLCDANPGRLAYAKGYIGADCPTFISLEEMLTQTNPEWLIVTSWDWEHHNHIITGMKHGCDIICEKPITIDEDKARLIREAEKKYGKKVVLTMNYRYPSHYAKLKELIMSGVIGDITSVDFHWNLHHPHLVAYMQRWHGERDKGGSLWVHKCTHHFDLVNWWLDSDPVEVFAYGDLERFGPKGPFRGKNCRNCEHTGKCSYYWNIMGNDHLRQLYADNEHHDGYIRDNCVFRNAIDIYDKHAAVVKYANNAYLNYSLTGESDYAGFWIAFNGTEGRLEGREGGWPSKSRQEWLLLPRGKSPQVIEVAPRPGGHWGGDVSLMEHLVVDPEGPDPLHQRAGTRDGLMSVLVGVAARKSIAGGKPVRIDSLTDIKPCAVRPRA